MNASEQNPLSRDGANKTVQHVERFWDENVCGAHFIDKDFASKESFSPEFYAAYREYRYRKEHHLNTVVDWESAKGKSVLEIGLGLGADASRWAQHADKFTGLDLTAEAVHATQRHFQILGLAGDIHQGNAELMTFVDDSFDLISSHGVLHHTENIDAALSEVFRVLKPGGTFIVMLYSKNSFNYWLRIQGWLRIVFLANLLKSKLRFSSKEPWESHLVNYRMQPGYFSWNGWPHHCTDGPDCQIANIYSWREMKKLLTRAGFQVNRGVKTHFPIGLPPAIERPIAKRIGFYQFAWCEKPAS